MSTKRAAILSNTALSKVCSSLNSSNSRKTLTFLKNLSTAAQRLDFENTNGSQCQVDDSLEYKKKHSESQNPADFYHKSNPNEGYRESNTHDFGTLMSLAQMSLPPSIIMRWGVRLWIWMCMTYDKKLL